MISVVLSIFCMAMNILTCYMVLYNDSHKWVIAIISALAGIQYYMMCHYISEYLFKQI